MWVDLELELFYQAAMNDCCVTQFGLDNKLLVRFRKVSWLGLKVGVVRFGCSGAGVQGDSGVEKLRRPHSNRIRCCRVVQQSVWGGIFMD